jgi:hypothetical protein
LRTNSSTDGSTAVHFIMPTLSLMKLFDQRTCTTNSYSRQQLTAMETRELVNLLFRATAVDECDTHQHTRYTSRTSLLECLLTIAVLVTTRQHHRS